MENTWHEDWLARLHQRVHTRGFNSVTAFADARPHATLTQLAAELGNDIAAIQIEGALCYEAEQAGTLEQYARALLVRRIRQRLPRGWHVGENFIFECAGVFAFWSAGVQGFLDKLSRNAVWESLQQTEIPIGWLPEGPDDPILARAFAGVRFDEPAGE
jgi:hypothetical protein